MFTGTFEHTLDVKGRLALPAKLREAIPYQGDRSVFVISRGHEGCLYLQTERDWESSGPVQPPNTAAAPSVVRKRDRLFFWFTDRVAVDTQGRILIPGPLKELAGITNNVVIAGVRNRIELWDKARWAAYVATANETYDQDDDEIFRNSAGRPPSGQGPTGSGQNIIP